MTMTSYTCNQSFNRRLAACLFSGVYSSHFCNFFTFTDDCDTDGEVGGKGRESSCVLPSMSILLDLFPRYAQMCFATGRIN